MKKIIFLCFCALLASCSSDEELQDISTNNEELANMINDYELVLKGYSLDELKKEKNESTPTTQEETDAEPWLIDALEKAKDFPPSGPILVITDGYIEDNLKIRREHAFLIPNGNRLPFRPKGKIFYMENKEPKESY